MKTLKTKFKDLAVTGVSIAAAALISGCGSDVENSMELSDPIRMVGYKETVVRVRRADCQNKRCHGVPVLITEIKTSPEPILMASKVTK